MKKLSLTVLSVVVALCLTLGIMLMMNTATAKADVVAGTTPTFSATKYKISSSDKRGMLIATGIKDCQDVYEVGYTFDSEVTAVNNSKTKYYTSITSGDKTWTVEDLFGDTYAGMIVWEVNYRLAKSYTFSAYAKVGVRNNGVLVYDPEDETVVNGTEKTVSAVPKTEFDFESASDLSYVSTSVGSAEIIGISDMVRGSSATESATSAMSGKVLKATNSDNAITIGLGKTVEAGTTVEFDFALTIPSKKELSSSNYVLVTVSGQTFNYWQFNGYIGHYAITLSASTDIISFSFGLNNLTYTIGTITSDIKAETIIYLDNLVVTEPLPSKTSFDFSGARDLEYVSITAGTAKIIDIGDMVVGSTGCSNLGNASGKVLKATNADTTVTINLGKTVAAGTKVELDFALTVPSKKDLCAGSNYVAVSISGQGYQYWHFDGKFRHATVTLSSATDKITFSFGLNNLTYTIGTITSDIKAETEIYFDNIVITEP